MKIRPIYSLKEKFTNDYHKNSGTEWMMVGAIILAIVITFISGMGERSVPKASADEQVEFGSYLQKEQERLSDLYRLQKSIAICEGSNVENSIPNELNNPGNLKAGGKTDSQGHTIYQSEVEGYLAHLKLLSTRYWGKTPKEMNKRYAKDPNWYKCVNFYYYDSATSSPR